MVFLATFLLCVGISVGSWVAERSSSFEGRFTVSIPASKDAPAAAERVEEMLRKQSGIRDVERLNDDDLSALLAPWLGNRHGVEQLPVPVVFEVMLEPEAAGKTDYNAIKTSLRSIAPGTELDAQEIWVQTFTRFSTALQQVLIVFAVLATCGLAMMVAFTSRSALKLHARTVQLLHSIGAEDRYVTRQFQHESLRLIAPGAFAGSACAGGVFAGLGYFIASLDSALMPSLAFSSAHGALLVAVPVACCLLSWAVARLIVMQQLGRSL